MGKLFILALITLLSFAAFGFPSQIDGTNLLQMCKDQLVIEAGSMSQDDYQSGQQMTGAGGCAGYLDGFVDTNFMNNGFINLITGILVKNGKLSTSSEVAFRMYKLTHIYCIPSDVTELQLAKVVVKFLENHPEKLNQSASLLVEDAFGNSFPCLDITKP